ncbi:MAG: hypothetical protein R6X02_16730 [Enhygromyxa sp.]
MQALRTVFVGLVFAAAVNLAGCRGLEQPYPPGKPPAVADLMAATAPGLRSIQVPRAKVRQGSAPAANLMIVAQAPARFAGTIQVSGNELVTLAVNEDEYGLRWLAGREGESLAPGYYSGPPSRCAVATLLGVDLEPEAFVEMVLGGAPLIAGPHEVLDRKWDRRQGRELLTIANDRYRQELAFAWIDSRWQFAAATLWATSGGEPVWLWTISHEELHEVGGEILPAKTQIRRPKPSGRGELVVTVTYQKQIPNPSLGGELPPDPPIDEEQPPNAGDTWDDWDDEGWEDDGADPSEAGAKPAAPDTPKPKSQPPTIPPQFRGNPTGLVPRGDLCVGRR